MHLYEDRGDDCVEALRGMFAFALWDRRRRRLLLARDRLGKKPLFYASETASSGSASEARAILQDPAIPRDMDPAAIDAFLRLQYVPSPASAFRALRKLPPGPPAGLGRRPVEDQPVLDALDGPRRLATAPRRR